MARLDDPLSRSWLRRGYQNPTPTWGQSVPELWAETPISIYRSASYRSEYGAMEGGPPQLIWSLNAHAEIEILRSDLVSQDFIGGPLTQHMYKFYCKWPIDMVTMPQTGDEVWFTTNKGESRKLKIKHVYSFDGLQDHLEIETVNFE